MILIGTILVLTLLAVVAVGIAVYLIRPRLCTSCWFRSKINERTLIHVRGEPVIIDKAPKCSACTQKYLSRFSTSCGTCGKLILVGEPVAASIQGDSPFAHYTSECSIVGSYLGTWGEGEVE